MFPFFEAKVAQVTDWLVKLAFWGRLKYFLMKLLDNKTHSLCSPTQLKNCFNCRVDEASYKGKNILQLELTW